MVAVLVRHGATSDTGSGKHASIGSLVGPEAGGLASRSRRGLAPEPTRHRRSRSRVHRSATVTAEPLDEEDLRPSSLMAKGNERLVLAVGVPGAGLLERRKLEDHDALGRLCPFDHLHGVTHDNRSPPV